MSLEQAKPLLNPISVEPLVRVENVTYTHWNQTEPTLKNLSLQILPGTMNVLVGPGGSGKSTLCSLFNGEIPHLLGGDLKGSVWVAGMDTRQVLVKDLSRRVGHVLQDPEAMFATLYVEDEIAFGPENLQSPVAEIRAEVEQLLAEIQMIPHRRNLVWNLSGGQVQKLGLAAILAMKPEMIVLDEPTANLDPQSTRSVHELIMNLRQQGMTVLLVTRELDDFILEAADQLLVLKDGSLLAFGAPQQVLAEHGSEMLHTLGIWLPETVEIGLALRQRLGIVLDRIPITTTETLALLQSRALLGKELGGIPPVGPAGLPGLNASNGFAAEVLVSARGLEFVYGRTFRALKGISFDVRAGEMLAIVGRNGAGKSTLAKLMVGLLRPQAGELTLFGRPARRWKVEDLADNIALVFQNPEHQFLTDTVFDEIAYSVLAHGETDDHSVRRKVEEMLHELGLEAVAKLHPFSLSAGMKRRLGVATMLVCQPRILLVDEPTYGQDKQMTHTLMALMEEIRARGVTIVMITHDMRLVQEYAERVIVMSDGNILFDGDPAGLFSSEEILFSASLRPTLLQEMLKEYETGGGCVRCAVRTTDDFLNALQLGEPHGV
jgi:energy-coupling factor transport system ATP-binding protein